MISKGIWVKWGRGAEYISFDPEFDSKICTGTTLEVWGAGRRKVVVKYNVLSEYDGQKLVVKYDRNENNIKEGDPCWGVSTIWIKPGEQYGKATWEDYDDPSNDGEADWELIKKDLKKTVSKRQSKTVVRDQMFRAALLAMSPGSSCVISGERCEMVLDAAHIIPSACGGNEVIENGLILRADLHRLYDAGAFRIDPTGRVVEVRNDLPHYYQTLLADKVLPEDTVRRVAEALELQWASASIAN